jgi:Flp pilus assembly protein TadG
MGFVVYRRKLKSSANDGGAIAIIVALLSVVLFGFAALVVDIGNADNVHQQGQSAVDAGSLAGVRVLANGGTTGEVVTAVKSYVDQNMGIKLTDWEGCKDPAALGPQIDTDVLVDTCISTSPATATSSFQVRVKLPTKHVPATFGGLFGVSSIGISPIAQALAGQPLPPECGPCEPQLDENTGQPKAPPPALPFPLPDPASVPLAPDPDAVSGCPAGPGLYTTDVAVLTGSACTLHPGLYVFDNSNLDVEVGANLASTLSAGTGVTLVFYGTGTLTVEGRIGVIEHSTVPGGPDVVSPLVATDPTVPPEAGQPIPGVAIVLDQVVPGIVAPRTFTLGDNFDITGSVYAVDPQTTWVTNTGDCAAVGSTCAMNVYPGGTPSWIVTTKTAFADSPRIPTVGPQAATMTASLPPHLVR